MTDNIKIWYIDEHGNQAGIGYSSELVEGSVAVPPNTETDVWNGEQWVTPILPQPTEEEVRLERIAELKGKLVETDYITLSDYDKDKPEILANRQAWRNEIRSLES